MYQSLAPGRELTLLLVCLWKNNSCPLCRAQVDPQAPGVSDTIENQRHVERMLALFHDLFGRGHGSGPGLGGNREEKKEDRSAYSGMYS